MKIVTTAEKKSNCKMKDNAIVVDAFYDEEILCAFSSKRNECCCKFGHKTKTTCNHKKGNN